MHQKNLAILEAATQAFSQNGYAGTTVDEIAALAGVNKATLYYRIGDKAEIYDQVLQSLINTVLAELEQCLPQATTATDKLRLYCGSIAKVCENQQAMAALILREVAAGGAHISDKTLEKMHQMRRALTRILQEGEQQSVFKPCNPFLIHVLIIGALNFYAAGQQLRQKLSASSELESSVYQLPVTQLADQICDLILLSITVE